jgi:hypothetical protein
LHGVANLGNAADTVLNRVVALPKSASGRSETFIDRSVTVIVETVANLELRQNGLLAEDRSPAAACESVHADSGDSREASCPAARVSVVDLAVAVVIEPVADLRDGEHCLLTRADAYAAVI